MEKSIGGDGYRTPLNSYMLADARAIAAFAGRGGVVIADTQPGRFDTHSRRLAQPALATGVALLVAPDDRTGLARLLADAGVKPEVTVMAPQDDVEMHVFHGAGGDVIGLQRSKPGEGTEDVTLLLPQPMSLTDILTGRSLGRVRRLDLKLDPVAPILLHASAQSQRDGPQQ